MYYNLIEIKKEQLSKIEHLWEELKKIHLNDSKYFKDYFSTFTFEKRCEKLEEINDEHIKIEIVEDKKTKDFIGYCISTIEKNIGEIDSLFIKEEYRKYGLGKKLVESSIEWLENSKCEKIKVGVAEGHESVFEFYKKLGFYPRVTYLELKK